MMQTPKKQQGMTLIGWILVFILGAVIALIALKLIPVYLDGYKVYQSLASLEGDDTARGKTPNEIRKMLLKRLDINMVSGVTSEDVTVSRSGNGTNVEVDYEVRINLAGNLYAVVVFNKTVLVPNR